MAPSTVFPLTAVVAASVLSAPCASASVVPNRGNGSSRVSGQAKRSNKALQDQIAAGAGGDVCDPAHHIDLPSPFEPSPHAAIYLASAEIKGIEKNQ